MCAVAGFGFLALRAGGGHAYAHAHALSGDVTLHGVFYLTHQSAEAERESLKIFASGCIRHPACGVEPTTARLSVGRGEAPLAHVRRGPSEPLVPGTRIRRRASRALAIGAEVAASCDEVSVKLRVLRVRRSPPRRRRRPQPVPSGGVAAYD